LLPREPARVAMIAHVLDDPAFTRFAQKSRHRCHRARALPEAENTSGRQ
jgi:hypothetical protein